MIKTSAVFMAAALFFSFFVKSSVDPLLWFVCFGIGCFLLLYSGNYHFQRGILHSLLILWSGYLTFSVFFLKISPAGEFFWTVFIAIPLYYFSLLRSDREEVLKWHGIALGFVLTVLAISATIQLFGGEGRVHWPFNNANNLAAILNIGLITSIWFSLKKKAFLCWTLLFLVALYATGSKGGVLCAGISVFVLISSMEDKYFLLCCVIAAVFGIACYHFFGALDVSIFNRVELWEAGTRMVKDHWLFGSGLGTYSKLLPFYVEQVPKARFFVHCDPLQIFIELGIFAFLLFYAICFTIILKTNRNNIAPFCVLLAVILHTHISFHLYMPPVGILMGFVLAWWSYSGERNEKQSTCRWLA